ncbi:hypothetical protein T439DRAFT_349142 [Meredithblackwellia eburnea MCA 4105]
MHTGTTLARSRATLVFVTSLLLLGSSAFAHKSTTPKSHAMRIRRRGMCEPGSAVDDCGKGYSCILDRCEYTNEGYSGGSCSVEPPDRPGASGDGCWQGYKCFHGDFCFLDQGEECEPDPLPGIPMCGPGLRCNGKCMCGADKSLVPCHQGFKCLADSDCADHLSCSVKGFCEYKSLKIGQECVDYPENCPDGSTCTANGVCGQVFNGHCLEDDDCSEGLQCQDPNPVAVPEVIPMPRAGTCLVAFGGKCEVDVMPELKLKAKKINRKKLACAFPWECYEGQCDCSEWSPVTDICPGQISDD